MENEIKHTPGPWKYEIEDDIALVSGEGWFEHTRVWVKIGGEESYYPQGIANSNLIASAPDLLEALEWAIETIKSLDGDVSILGIMKCYEAINKAKGQ